MDRTELESWLATAPTSRRRSKDAFGREFLVEIGLAIKSLDSDSLLVWQYFIETRLSPSPEQGKAWKLRLSGD